MSTTYSDKTTVEASVETELLRLSEHLKGMQSGTALAAALHAWNEELETPDPLFIEEYLPIIESENAQPGSRPFLSVITRTQGKRPEMLREALLSLAAQTDQDFELLLIGHKLSAEQFAHTEALIAEFPSSLREKLRFLQLDHGGRTTPLNFGFAHARGEYISILDDDDLVFDHWVESFHRAALSSPGRVLHSLCSAQEWSTVTLPQGREGLRAEKGIDKSFCRVYDPLRELESNICPPVGLAFPAFVFRELGVIFDESLTTTEDWDYLMRASALSGVADTRENCGMYRLWSNTETSQTLHSKAEWDKNYELIQKKLRERPALLPPGSSKVYKLTVTKTETETQYISPPLLRIQIKDRLREKIPRPIWFLCKKLYRLFGGKKWLG